ncbi:hypothetical protein [Herpetosiphon giganteus]|uniref:hypothetical protein n=1 Tax=Herpetosiphon giganteus TaxID=2029754 RepID=UPI00195A2F8C|nr:hypothetical protein [Herpetosiphon giganteus]MBM7845935.1 hypothetical protein [Herpetosiphon giganteus]
MSFVHPYFDYYHPIITAHTTGIKQVLGGTGLGKTSGIAATIKHTQTDRKYMYCANRIQLLQEMAERLDADGIGYVHLQNDTDTVYSLLHDDHRERFYEFLRHPLVVKYAESTTLRGGIAGIEKLCHDVGSHLAHIRQFPFLEDHLGRQVHRILNFVKRLLIDAATRKRTHDHQTLLKHPVIQQLFPYIKFRHDATKRILLLTIQKAFYGFFDGKTHVNLSTLMGDHGQHIIFLDEFDFLENNLIDLICNDGQIDAPLHFVEAFYRAMKRHKLPSTLYLSTTPVRTAIEDIVEQIDQLHLAGLDYPQINQFTYSNEMQQPITIFETSRTLLTNDLYVQPTTRSFELVTAARQGTTIDVDTLFRVVHQVTTDILRVLKDLESADPALYRELVQQCFDTTVFKRQLEQIRQPPHLPLVQRTRFNTLLDRGYGVYEVHRLKHTSDPDVVDLAYYGIYTTPEKLLLNLATHNLVFGLSATADIPRYLRGFNDTWLQQQEGLHYHPVTENDIAIVQHLNADKQIKRGNRVTVIPTTDLDSTNQVHKQLMQFTKGIADDDGFGGNDPQGYRRKRVERFFATLLWIADQPSAERSDTHLLFFNSYRQIQHMFVTHPYPEDDLFRVTLLDDIPKPHDRLLASYELAFAGRDYLVVFYDAKQGQRINAEQQLKAYYQSLFWRGKPVLIITTYPSAGNGINLQYYPDDHQQEEKDIQHVHLLESPYFYFGVPDPQHSQQERNAIVKQNIWYLAKLYEGKVISEQEFKIQLTNIHNASLNSRYHTDMTMRHDATLNQLATFIQAIGRVERVWSVMPDQTIHMSRDVYEVFELFSTSDAYASLREQRLPTLSNNLRQVFAQITNQTKRMVKEMRRKAEERLHAQNNACEAAINTLLDDLGAFRRGQRNEDIRNIWLQLRHDVLQHTIHSPLLDRYGCWFSTSYIADGYVFIDWDTLTLYPHRIWHATVSPWPLNSPYDLIVKHPVIRQHFERKGYELAFSPTLNRMLTPFCYQAILLGAIGEEAVAAIFQDELIHLDTMPNSLFEIVDLKLAGLPWYIDCKNYSERTLEQFTLSSDDPAWRPNLNNADFTRKAVQKLMTLRAFHHNHPENCKLIYINLSSREERGNQYFDAAFKPVQTMDAASIIFVPSVINATRPDTLSVEMDHVIKEIHEARGN